MTSYICCFMIFTLLYIAITIIMVGIAQLVERQVVALEVEGSTPSSYPISNNIQILTNLNIMLSIPHKNYLSYNSIYNYYSFMTLPLTRKLASQATINTNKPKYRTTLWIKSSFKLFSSVSSYNRKKLLKPHHTFVIDGYINSGENGGFSNIRLFFNAYKRFYLLLQTLIYHNISKLVFTGPFFKDESCAMNWQSLSSYLFIWKYNYYSIFYRPSKLDDRLPMIFSLFKQAGITSSLISDTLYHSKTVYYLHRYNIYSIGFVEGNKPKHVLNVSLPALGDNILSQLFFIRSILILKRLISLK